MVMENSNDHRMLMPTTIMNVGHHFDDIPRTIQRDWVADNTGKENTPRKMLHDVVLNSHLRSPNTRS